LRFFFKCAGQPKGHIYPEKIKGFSKALRKLNWLKKKLTAEEKEREVGWYCRPAE
jgi:hypothetical protein